ncbi:N-acetylglucosamine-6-phosphate deacetylase [Diaminobutyricimonas aerilata]|uniref:N-acetylglucosamine-6-phosphate deacetylase n=1 Tax=Diaminobutyricimonas aerilata TaxID=1162967 RepID=A0A2M9CMM8_9MICO|nr:N-acetylglucosamine-6-phosphate deacetylase [Diaminobutyricimonas aerilata]PJJ73104.1 N-acetylglucosamine-6-phosphate deacetylase [Diaminobutyricimonas aerilata]
MSVLIRDVRLLDARTDEPGWVLFDGAAIAATGTGAAPDADDTVDGGGRTLVPGFIDLHEHGAGGHSFDDGPDAIRAALAVHRAHGTTRSVISLVTNPVDVLESSLRGIAELSATDPLVLGAHLEGPFLAPERRGAHNVDFLRSPDSDTIERLLAAADGSLRQITIAPELPGALDAIERLTAAGVAVAVGHTEADADRTREAFDRGARLLTHAFNAMPGIHHRAPGPVATALADERVVVELILDGEHVHPDVAALTFAAAPGRVALVTDAMAAAGAHDGDYRLGSLNVTVENGLAVLSGTHTIAGSTLTQDAALRFARERVGVTDRAAVEAVTLAPARALGLDDRLGLLAPGYAADAVLLEADGSVARVWGDGSPIA